MFVFALYELSCHLFRIVGVTLTVFQMNHQWYRDFIPGKMFLNNRVQLVKNSLFPSSP